MSKKKKRSKPRRERGQMTASLISRPEAALLLLSGANGMFINIGDIIKDIEQKTGLNFAEELAKENAAKAAKA